MCVLVREVEGGGAVGSSEAMVPYGPLWARGVRSPKSLRMRVRKTMFVTTPHRVSHLVKDKVLCRLVVSNFLIHETKYGGEGE